MCFLACLRQRDSRWRRPPQKLRKLNASENSLSASRPCSSERQSFSKPNESHTSEVGCGTRELMRSHGRKNSIGSLAVTPGCHLPITGNTHSFIPLRVGIGFAV